MDFIGRLRRWIAVARPNYSVLLFPGGNSERATPVPIPNTEVKPLFADGTVWVTAWESRKLPGHYSWKARLFGGLFYSCGNPGSGGADLRKKSSGRGAFDLTADIRAQYKVESVQVIFRLFDASGDMRQGVCGDVKSA